MIWVDIAIVALLAIFSTWGIFRGFSQEWFALAAWISGLTVAWFFSQHFVVFLVQTIHSPSTRLAMSFLCLVLITLAVAAVIKFLLADAIKKTGLNLLDRLGGLLLGGCHGLLAVTTLVLAAGLTQLPKDRWWQESKYLPPFQAFAILLKDHVSSKVALSISYS